MGILLASCGSGSGSLDVIVRVIDEETGRGVPLVELTLPNDVKYWTDSAGVAVFDEPSLQGAHVFVTVRSSGYEYLGETLLGSGASIDFVAGNTELLQNFGAVYYAEADAPEGPYGEAVQIIEHDQYNFYNVLLHPYFDQDGGRVVFIEGTYTDAF